MSASPAYFVLSSSLLCSFAGWPVRVAANIFKVSMGITACRMLTLVSSSSRSLHAR
jgi:hypothetical protein